jgi:hypothetical protein
MSSVFALSVHADYACRHSGACCTAGWPIPVELEQRALLGGPMLFPGADGACRHYDRGARLCRVHAAYGDAQLPRSCHHFPRRALVDERGTFVTLSHFCPTAADALFSPGALSIVRAPKAFPTGRGYDGLDARGQWPPLVKPALLFDLESYTAWEEFLIATFADERLSADGAVRRVAAAAERLRSWTPRRGAMVEWIRAIAAQPEADGRVLDRYAPLRGERGHRFAVKSVPPALRRSLRRRSQRSRVNAHVAPGAWAGPIRRYLASKAFGSWTAYDGHGVRTQVAELVLTLSVLHTEMALLADGDDAAVDRAVVLEAIRASDLLLVHLAHRPTLMRRLRAVERQL